MMRKGILIVLLILVAGSLGVALAAGIGSLVWKGLNPLNRPVFGYEAGGRAGPGMLPRSGSGGWGMGPGMMHRWKSPSGSASGQRLTLDQATERASAYIHADQPGFVLSEVMEFEENFYFIVKEDDTQRGAFEILVDPYSGDVYAEPGPNMMWNLKYGHMGGSQGDNDLSIEKARELAQAYLDANISGAQIEGEGTVFYGYFTFDYTVNGTISGMLSINGFTGDAWVHTWHGQFISEKEFEK